MSIVDLSHHQSDAGRIDYARVRPAVDAAYLKVSQGASYVDPAWRVHWSGLAGVPRGPYHYCTGADPHLEARHFAAVVGATPFELRPAIDIEYAGATADWLRIFMTELRKTTGWRRLRVYTGLALARTVLDPAAWIDDDTDLWIARYAPALGWTHPQLALWQRTQSGTVPGISGPVDLSDAMNGWTPTHDITGADMPLSQDDVNRIVDALLTRPLADLYPDTPTRTMTLADTIAWAAANAGRALTEVRKLADELKTAATPADDLRGALLDALDNLGPLTLTPVHEEPKP